MYRWLQSIGQNLGQAFVQELVAGALRQVIKWSIPKLRKWLATHC